LVDILVYRHNRLPHFNQNTRKITKIRQNSEKSRKSPKSRKIPLFCENTQDFWEIVRFLLGMGVGREDVNPYGTSTYVNIKVFYPIWKIFLAISRGCGIILV